MTIEREEPDVWVAYCDGCGERLVLDVDGRSEREEAEADLEEKGWTARKPATAKFANSMPTYKVEYLEHDCLDCA